jgi:hypothetical protein
VGSPVFQHAEKLMNLLIQNREEIIFAFIKS